MNDAKQRVQALISAGAALALEGEYDLSDRVLAVAALLEPKRPECTCRGPVPEDPCGHGDTSEGCPRHDPNYEADYYDSSGNPWNFSEPEADEVAPR